MDNQISSIIEQKMVGGIRFALVRNSSDGKLLFRARGHVYGNPIVPVESDRESYDNLHDFIHCVVVTYA